MLWVPVANDEVLNEALPPLSVPVPSVVVPSENVTVPVGVPELALTVAVKVTDCPKTDGFAFEARAVVVERVQVNVKLTLEELLLLTETDCEPLVHPDWEAVSVSVAELPEKVSLLA